MKQELGWIWAIWLAVGGSAAAVPAEPGQALSRVPDAAFARALAPRQFEFPVDHAAHPTFQDEWWYFTGNLYTPEQRRFGFQVTYFRHAFHPSARTRNSRWAAHQVYLAHFAISDVVGKRFHHFERYARDALGLAGVDGAPFAVWLEDWRLTSAPGGSFPWQLTLREGDIALRLQVEPEKPVIAQGQDGLSQKGAAPGHASYYYAIPRLAARGELRLGEQVFPVTGRAWLDREWSTQALEAEQIGWDWFALQLRDGKDLMWFQLRRKDGQPDPHDAGSWIGPDGKKVPLHAGDAVLEPLAYWRSPDGARYPIRWRLVLPTAGKRLIVQAALPDQEWRASYRYWEGAVDVFDEADDLVQVGEGYLEMTGYHRGSAQTWSR